MKILFVSERLPYPLIDGGNLRTYHVLKALSERHQVTLLSHFGGTADARELGDLERFCTVETVPKPAVSTGRKLISGARALLGAMPYNVLSGHSEPLFRRYRELLAEGGFDAVHFNHFDTAAFALAHAPDALTVFDSHNVVWHIVDRMARAHGNPVMAALIAAQAKKMAALEGRICRAMDLVLTCSAIDSDGFSALHPGGRYRVVENGVDVDYFASPDGIDEVPGRLAFTGAMGYFPNEDGILFFCERILPLLPDGVSLSVVGSKPSEKVVALRSGQINVTGFVDDVRPYMAEAQIMLVPLRIAGGTRLKILEAFAMGKAVVSTPEGAEGIDAVPGKEILIADTPETFAGAVIELLNDPDRRRTLAEQGRAVALQKYDWRIIGAKVVAEYHQVLDQTVNRAADQAADQAADRAAHG